MTSNGHAIRNDAPIQANRLIGFWDRAAISSAQFLVLFGIVFGMWRYGAVETTALHDLAVVFSLANLLALGSPSVWASRIRFPWLIPAVGLTFVLYVAAQSANLTTDCALSNYDNSYAAEPIAMLVEASDRLGGDRPLLPAPAIASAIPEATRQALVPFALGLMVVIVSSIVFQTQSSRKLYLWTIVINASVLTIWGIIQRANHNQEILPGIPYQSHGVPFASFGYKNAGAAALLPALAITVALLVYRRRQGSSDRGYGTSAGFPSVHSLMLFSVLALLAAGLAVSLSRGAWIAAAAAAIVVAVIQRRKLTRTNLVAGPFLFAGLGAVAMIAAIALISRTSQPVFQRSADLSINRVQSDARWHHWVDAMQAAMAHSPWGSGLGTYGYVTLPYQSQTYVLWFKNAHNQFVESWVEMGFPGLLLWCVVAVWFGYAARKLSRPDGRSEWKQWGLIAAASLVCATVQGAVDYVLIIPAILCLYASLIGITGAVLADMQSHPMSQHPTLLRRATPAGWCLVALLAGCWAFKSTGDQLTGDLALDRTLLSSMTTDAPTETEIESRITTLDLAIRRQPARAELFSRRANWHLASYRLQLLNLAATSNISLTWSDTTPDSLFLAIAGQDRSVQSAVRNDLLATKPMRQSLSRATADLAGCLARNPYQPQTYLAAARLSPLLDLPLDRWTKPTSQLANNSCDMLFCNGWLACHRGDTETAVDQWQKSLSIRGRHLRKIYSLALERLPPQQVAVEVIPAHCTDLQVRLIQEVSKRETSGLLELIDQIITRVERCEQMEPSLRFAAIAKIQSAAGRDQASVNSWRQAVRLDGRNLEFRFRLAQSLRTAGLLDEAINQISLIQTMSPEDPRFAKFAADIRRQLTDGLLN